MSAKHISIWTFEDAPPEYRKPHKVTGRESFLMFIPAGFPRMDLAYGISMERESGFAVSGASMTYLHDDKSQVIVGLE